MECTTQEYNITNYQYFNIIPQLFKTLEKYKSYISSTLPVWAGKVYQREDLRGGKRALGLARWICLPQPWAASDYLLPLYPASSTLSWNWLFANIAAGFVLLVWPTWLLWWWFLVSITTAVFDPEHAMVGPWEWGKGGSALVIPKCNTNCTSVIAINNLKNFKFCVNQQK